MNTNYLIVVAGLLFLYTGRQSANAQTPPEFLNCPTSPQSLCISDPGIRLLATNQFYLGHEDPNATSCSMHVTQHVKIKSTCGQHLQYEVQLFIHDTSAAYIIKAPSTVVVDSSHEAELEFDTELAFDDGIRQFGIPYGTGCMPYSRIKWIVSDSCGDTTICEQLIDLYDCFAPVDIMAQNVRVIHIPIGGQITVFVIDLLSGLVDDCSAFDECLYSFEESHYNPDSTFVCNVPAFGVEFPWTLYVADKGRDIDCSGSVAWEERTKYPINIMVVFLANGNVDCEKTGFNFRGEILTSEFFEPISMVQVNLVSQGHFFPFEITSEIGRFDFHISYLNNKSYEIESARNDWHKNGVSTLDLIQILKHLLGYKQLNPYDLIAADADNSQSVSIIDLVELKKLILNINTVLPNNHSWRFIPKDFVFPDTLYPWPFPEKISFQPSGTENELDFIGIKIGDINNTVEANAQSAKPRSIKKPLWFHTDPASFSSNELVEINLYADDLTQLDGFQMTIADPDLDFNVVTSSLPDFAEDSYAIFGDHLTLSWFSLDPVLITSTEPILTIKATAARPGNLNALRITSEITDAEAYVGDEILEPRLSLDPFDSTIVMLHDAEPNPWSQQCVIPFSLKADHEVLFSLYDITGNLVYEHKAFYQKGNQEIILTPDLVETRGLLFYTLRCDREWCGGSVIRE